MEKGGGPVQHDNVDLKRNEVIPPSPVLNGYPVGKRLRAGEFEASKQFSPKEANTGETYCWNFNANCGCSRKGNDCPFGIHQSMKRSCLHWAVRAQLARRGGLRGSQILDEKAAEGFIHALREANVEKDKGRKKGKRPHRLTEEYRTHRPPMGDIPYQKPPMSRFLLHQG